MRSRQRSTTNPTTGCATPLSGGRCVRLLHPGGRLVLVEGRCGTGAGLTAAECRDLVLRHRSAVEVRLLSDSPALWGGSVDDERYLVSSPR